jgi:hypothetical protein
MTKPADYNAKGLAIEIKDVGLMRLEVERLKLELQEKEKKLAGAETRLMNLAQGIIAL